MGCLGGLGMMMLRDFLLSLAASTAGVGLGFGLALILGVGF